MFIWYGELQYVLKGRGAFRNYESHSITFTFSMFYIVHYLKKGERSNSKLKLFPISMLTSTEREALVKYLTCKNVNIFKPLHVPLT